MYETLEAPAPDEILQLSIAFNKDPRHDKLDLGIGVYRNSTGASTVMAAVKSAEAQLLAEEQSKAYLGLAGDEAFGRAMNEWVLGDAIDASRTRTVQTPGGAAALRTIFEFAKVLSPSATVWISTPTWLNHRPLIEAAGLSAREYSYIDTATQRVLYDRMLQDLRQAKPGDVVLLHGSCHNPSGANLDDSQWRELAALIGQLGLLPVVDVAYLGFGLGLNEDAFGVRHLVASVPEVLVAVSCSKSFGLYRERTGCAIAVAADSAAADLARANLLRLIRVNYSFPPNHGAAVVRMILEDADLRASWTAELESMRTRLTENRRKFSEAMGQRLGEDRFEFVRRQRGMFSLIGLDRGRIASLREHKGIYIPSDGRLNFSGITDQTLPHLATALTEILR